MKHDGDLSLADLQQPPRGGITFVKADAERVEFANTLTVRNAEDLVFARDANQDIATLVAKYRDHQTQLVHTTRPMSANGGFLTQAGIYVGPKRG